MRLFSARKPLEFSRYLLFLEQSRLHGRESLLFCEHKPTITAGLQSKPEHLLQSPKNLALQGISYHPVLRGGEQTAHEPGQLLFYVHLNLEARGKKLGHLFGALLEFAQAAILQVWGIDTHNLKESPGLYTSAGQKLLSIGLDYRKHLTGFGIALNIKNDCKTFSFIHPCGDPDLSVGSIAWELQTIYGRKLSSDDIQKYKDTLVHMLALDFTKAV